MAPRKRKREEYESSDEEPLLGKQVLPVADLPDDFDGEPLDGAQYLFTVRRDSQLLPLITRVANPYEYEDEKPEKLPKISPEMPSDEWQRNVTMRFKNFKKNLAQPTIHVSKPPGAKVIPDKKDRNAWWAFLAGKSESEWNPPKRSKTDKARDGFRRTMRGFSEERLSETSQVETWRVNEEGEVERAVTADPGESLPTPNGTPAPPDATEIEIKMRQPTQSLLQHIDDRMSLHLLMYFTHWIKVHIERSQTSELTETHARWIFALLSRVGDFISADDTSLLRNLARACISLLVDLVQKRAKAHGVEQLRILALGDDFQGSMCERSCWVLLSVIVGVWAQRDLWKDAGDALSPLGI